MQYDIIIVGASFAGITLAKNLPQNLKVLLIDRKQTLDAGIESTGLITQATYQLLEEMIDIKKYVPNNITTICVVSPNYDKHFFSYTKDPWIFSTDTPKLIKALAETLPSNVQLEIGANLTSVEFKKDDKPSHKADFNVQINYSKNGTTHQATAQFIVGADGARSTVAQQNPTLPKNKKYLAGLEKVFYGNINFGDHPQSTVYHFWFGEFSIGYGGWLSPTIINNRPAFRVGLAKLEKDIKHLNKLDEFIKILHEQKIIDFEEKTVFSFGSLIPIGGPLKKPYDQNSLLIGDAAGLCGAFAADGIKGAIISGKVAAEIIPKHLNGDKKALSTFHKKIQTDHHKMMTYYYKQMLYRFVWNRMKSNRSFHLMYDLIAREKDKFLHQFCDSKDKNTSLVWIILKLKNLSKLTKYALSLVLDFTKKTAK